MSAMASQQRSRKALGLWMNGHFVGTWSLEAGGDVLQYDSQWVQSPQRRPLSLSLPFTPGNRPHKGNAVRFYFENLLPDSKDIRERVARRYQVGATDAPTPCCVKWGGTAWGRCKSCPRAMSRPPTCACRLNP